MSVESNLKNGFEALRFVNKTHKSALGAMYRKDTGLIDFIWGEPGTGEKFKHGYGIAHIIAKRDAENGDGLQVASKLIEVIAKGTDTDCQNSSNNGGEYRLRIHYAGYTAVVSSASNDKNAWLLTGWQDGANKKKRNNG